MAIAAFAYGFVITLVFSLPADWAWRRGGTAVTAVTSLVNVAAIVAAVILAGALGLYTGALAVAALVVGIVLAGMAGDATATALGAGRASAPGKARPVGGKPTRRRFLGGCDVDV